MAVIEIINIVFTVYMLMLFVRILGSWLPELQGTTFMQFIAHYTDPYLAVFRRVIPPLGMIDISPIVAFFALAIIENLVKWLVVTLLPL